MNASTPYIPSKTRLELASPAAPGGRHAQMVRAAVPLIAQGFTSEAVFVQLRSMYRLDVPDSEIAGVIHWASGKNFSPCRPRFFSHSIVKKKIVPTISPIEQIEKFLHGSNVESMTFDDLEAELWEASPWRPLENWRMDSLMFLAGMYHAGELVNVVTEHGENGKPKGYGRTLARDAWMREIRDHGAPQSEAGAWIRMNPTDGKGITDANVTAFRFALLEFDNAPLELQLGLLVKLRLPVAAILTSGGKSAHAWVRVDAKDVDAYREIAAKIHSLLGRFGIDPSNKNPSRLSRLVGAQRIIGAQEDGRQRLLYFNPDATEWNSIL